MRAKERAAFQNRSGRRHVAASCSQPVYAANQVNSIAAPAAPEGSVRGRIDPALVRSPGLEARPFKCDIPERTRRTTSVPRKRRDAQVPVFLFGGVAQLVRAAES